MNNEPVAYGLIKNGVCIETTHLKNVAMNSVFMDKEYVPLYTHPAPLEPKVKRACKKCIEQQAEIEALKERLRPCQPLCKPSVCDCFPVKQTYRETHEGFSTVIETTHLAKELNAGGEPVKNANYWKKQHDGLLMKLNISAIKIAELEKDLALKTRERECLNTLRWFMKNG